MREFKVGDWVTCIKDEDLGYRIDNDTVHQIEIGDVVKIYNIVPNTGVGTQLWLSDVDWINYSWINVFRKSYLHEIPEEHRPKLITKEEKNKLLDLIKSI